MCKKHFMQDSNNILIELFYLESPQTLGKKFKWILKVWTIYVVGVVVDVGVNFSHFHLLLQNHGANFNQTWHKASLVKGIPFCSNEGPRPFPRGDFYELEKIHWGNFKIFSRTTGPILTNNTSLGEVDSSLFKWRKIAKFKSLLLQNHWANFNQT